MLCSLAAPLRPSQHLGLEFAALVERRLRDHEYTVAATMNHAWTLGRRRGVGLHALQNEEIILLNEAPVDNFTFNIHTTLLYLRCLYHCGGHSMTLCWPTVMMFVCRSIRN